MNEQELNKLKIKLAEWAEFELMDTQFYEHSFGNSEVETWRDPNGHDSPRGCPNFPESLDACFTWLVPKVYDMELIKRNRFEGLWQIAYRARVRLGGKPWADAISHKEPALALCLAIEKLIDSVPNDSR